MIKFQIITLFPEYFKTSLQAGLLGRAMQKGVVDIELIDLRKFSQKKYGQVDDRPFGGGDSMIISYPVLEGAIKSLKNPGHVVYPCPQGSLWNYKKAREYARKNKLITCICGRYGGIDSRFTQDYVNESLSIGDYVLNGGEVACLVLIESIFRFLPGALGNDQSSDRESFEEEGLLEGPQWTRPQSIKDHKIPQVVLEGHHKNIEEFRKHVSLVLTHVKRPDLFPYASLKDKLKTSLQALKSLSMEELKSLDLRREDLELDDFLSK